jgi:hypothetical protein
MQVNSNIGKAKVEQSQEKKRDDKEEKYNLSLICVHTS